MDDPLATDAILSELRALIEGARQRVAVSVNRELVLLYWDLGKRIRVETLNQERAEYGEQIVQTLSGQLTQEFGTGYSRANLFSMIKFAEQGKRFLDCALLRRTSLGMTGLLNIDRSYALGV